jgi:hypothetical protein
MRKTRTGMSIAWHASAYCGELTTRPSSVATAQPQLPYLVTSDAISARTTAPTDRMSPRTISAGTSVKPRAPGAGGSQTGLSMVSRSVPLCSWLNRTSSTSLIDASTKAGHVSRPSARDALVRWWPAMIRPSCVTMIGLANPISVIDAFSMSRASAAILRGLYSAPRRPCTE